MGFKKGVFGSSQVRVQWRLLRVIISMWLLITAVELSFTTPLERHCGYCLSFILLDCLSFILGIGQLIKGTAAMNEIHLNSSPYNFLICCQVASVSNVESSHVSSLDTLSTFAIHDYNLSWWRSRKNSANFLRTWWSTLHRDVCQFDGALLS